MKCVQCGCFDSYTEYYYVDLNGEVFGEAELEAFKILHPEVKNINFRRVLLCGLCAAQFKMNF